MGRPPRYLIVTRLSCFENVGQKREENAINHYKTV